MQKESGKRESPYKGILRFAKEKKSQLSFAVVLSVLSSAFGVVPYIAVAVLLQKALENSLTTNLAVNFPKNRLYKLMTTKPSDTDGTIGMGRAA